MFLHEDYNMNDAIYIHIEVSILVAVSYIAFANGDEIPIR